MKREGLRIPEPIRQWKRNQTKQQEKSGADTEKPDPINDIAFLYIRATEDDRGERPIGTPWWLSPDLNVLSAEGSEKTQIEVGVPYTFECRVWNGGGLEVPSATIEFFLVSATLGRFVSVSKQLQLFSALVPAVQGGANHGTTKVDFSWTAGSEDVGHKCLISRVYSFSPLDLPNDFEFLDPPNDRHVAQQNLNILEQSSEVSIDIDYCAPTAIPYISPQQKSEIKLEETWHKFNVEIEGTTLKQLPEFLQCKKEIRKFLYRKDWKEVEFRLKPGKGTDLEIDRQSANHWSGKFSGNGFTSFTLTIPDLGLDSNEAVIYHVIQRHKEKVTGGLTLIVYST